MIKRCIDCKHSADSSNGYYYPECTNPKVLQNRPLYLGGGHKAAISCIEIRSETSWFATCGIRGKLWESK